LVSERVSLAAEVDAGLEHPRIKPDQRIATTVIVVRMARLLSKRRDKTTLVNIA
jgi:hypothetical protein